MKRMLIGICLAICLVCGVVEVRADCSGIDDPYLKAKCEVEGQKASGLVGAGILAPNMTKVPQYSGSPGCVTAGCSGAAEEKYYDDPGSLSAAGGAAASSDERYSKIQQSRIDRDGWDLRTSSPVTTAQSTAATLPTDSIMTESCSVVNMCTSYTEGAGVTGTCQVPGGSRQTCLKIRNPTLLPNACTVPGIPSPPYTSETEVNGCKDLEAAGASGLAALVTTTCLDGAARDLKCSQPYATVLTGGTSGFNAHDHAPGMAMGNFTIESAFPIWDGTRWVVGLNVTGNSAGEDKYGCTNVGSVKTGPYVLTPANPTASGNGSPAYCNSKCSCFGYPMTFTMGAFSPTGPLSWQVPFTFTYESHSIAVMVTGTFLDTYSVAPLTGCFQEEQTWDVTSTAGDTCGEYRDKGCNQVSSRCASVQPETGYCLMYENTYKCPGPSECSTTQPITQCTKCGKPDSPVPFCVDTSTPPNENLALAATWLAMTKNVEEDWDPDRLRIFTGKRSTCDFSTIGRSLINCCDSDPDKLIGKCSEEEIALARDKQDRKAHLIGTHCVDKGSFLVGSVCLRKEEVYCTMKSELGRMVQEQGRVQLGMTWGSADAPQCDGFTVDQFSALNFQAMDFTEWYKNVSANIDPAVITKEMATKICTYTGTC